MDPTFRMYSEKSPNRVGRPLGTSLVGYRFESVIVSITTAELANERNRDLIQMARSRQMDPAKPVTLEVY